MNFIITTKKEQDLQGLLRSYQYKFLDIEILKEEWNRENENCESEFNDIHFNFHLTNKIQNNFKSSKSQFFVYRVPQIQESILSNILKFIELKYSEKFKNLIILTEGKIKIDPKILKRFDVIEYNGELETLQF